jgi:serine/threonine-protein kinase
MSADPLGGDEANTAATAGMDADPAARPRLVRGATVGRYLVLDVLGEGGMGVVYKAYDPELDRPIALKVLLTAEDASSGQRDRLLREAQALARLSHPNVIAVHDVGTFGRDVFIAMEFVEGKTMRQWLKAQPRTQREILDVFLAAGEGLAAAHRAGLVHRDFKPDNVMVGDDQRVRVLDFGIARAARTGDDPTATVRTGPPTQPASVPAPAVSEEVSPTVTARSKAKRTEPALAAVHTPPTDSGSYRSSASSTGSTAPRLLSTPLTNVGATVGTPRFMAPEQYLGQSVDEAADQFSFCVSLYWALYGAYPFAGVTLEESIELMLKGRIAEPPPEARVPRWLRLVLLRGLQVKTADRFASMSALLAALRADPQVARRRWLSAAGSVIAVAAVTSAVVAGVLAYRVRRVANEQARLGQQFGQEVERIGAISRYAASLPLHDTRREMDLVRARLAKLERSMHALGPIAAGPGHEALGRGYLALERYDEALTELDAAWAIGYRSPELAYALGLVHGKLYQRGLADLPKTSDEKLDAARRAELARAHRDPALRYLKETASHEGDGAAVEAPEYVEGLIAMYEQRFDEALALAKKAAGHALWMYEGRTLEGDIHYMLGRERYWKGDVDTSLAQYRLAGAAYRAAVEVARSGAAAYDGDCRRLLEMSVIEVDRDQAPDATVKEALAACTSAAAARSDDADPLTAQARAWQHLGNYQTRHGVDPTPAQMEAIRLGQKALAVNPREVRAHYVIGWAYLTISEHATEKGKDPRAWLEEGIAHAQKASELEPSFSQSFSLLCHLYDARGSFEQSRGEDPRSSFRAAADWAKKAIAVAPDSFHAFNALGISLQAIGAWELTHGEDPTESFTRATDAFEHVVKLSPTLDYGFINGCEAYLNWGIFLRQRGDDPRPRLEQAMAACQRALELDGNYPGTHFNLGAAYHALARFQVEHSPSIDPEEMMGRSRAEFERTLTIDRTYSPALQGLAESRLLEARWAVEHHRAPDAALAAAEVVARRALALAEEKSPESLGLLAELNLRRAEWRQSKGLAAEAEVREGLALAARALQENAKLADVAATEGALHLVTARAARAAAPRQAAAERARVALEKALAIDANLERECRPLLAEASRLAAP